MSTIETTNRTRSPARPSGPVAWLKKHPLANYFALAYGITWLSLLSATAAAKLGLVPSEPPVLGVAVLLGVFVPAIAALVIAALSGHDHEVIDLLKRVVRWRSA